MLAPDGRCKTLDSSADGYSRSESCVSLCIGSAAQRESGITVIVGTACNQDGRSSSLTAPNGPSQTNVILRSQKIFTRRSGYKMEIVQLHGTGTALGDPIEFAALSPLYDSPSDCMHYPLRCSTSKANVGHSEPGAGLMSLYHLIVSMEACSSLATPHLRTVNPSVSNIVAQPNDTTSACFSPSL